MLNYHIAESDFESIRTMDDARSLMYAEHFSVTVPISAIVLGVSAVLAIVLWRLAKSGKTKKSERFNMAIAYSFMAATVSAVF